MRDLKTAIIHYSAPPVIGGVESVIQAHADLMIKQGFPVSVIAGRGSSDALTEGVEYIEIPELDSQHPDILEISAELERGNVPDGFDDMLNRIFEILEPVAARFDTLIAHNIFGKRFNLPLTGALARLMDVGVPVNWILWGHDFDWTSPRSRSKVHDGFPWDLLRTAHPRATYVVVSEKRREELAGLLKLDPEEIVVVYNGVDPGILLGLTDEGQALVRRLDLLSRDLVLLMPVRVTQAKNIEFALRVVAALKDRGIHPLLVLTGPPDPHDEEIVKYFRELQELRKELGVEDSMRFVYESGPEGEEGYIIGLDVVSDLFRMSDVMFMPSHREGYGMPVLEAGLVGVRVVSIDRVPSVREIGRRDVLRFEESDGPETVAGQILEWAESDPVHRLKRRMRQDFTWEAIFTKEIEPLLLHGTGNRGRSA